MVLRKLVGLFACTLILGAASFAMAGVPDLQESTASPAFTTGDIVLYNLPDGGGNDFTLCRYWDGSTSNTVDGTVSLVLRDAASAPIEDFPFEDLWLNARDGGLFLCAGGTTADANTDEMGMTQWANPLRCGGWSSPDDDNLAQVYVNGDALTSAPGMALFFNSADINGSGQVELSDVTAFSSDFFGAYAFRSDFTFDTTLDLLDVTKLSAGFGSQCQ